MKVVVTGGAGRLGRSVVDELARAGHETVSVDRTSAAVPGASRSLAVDLADPEAVAAAFDDVRPEAVVHLAAIASPFSAPEDVILRTNTMLAMTVLRAAVDAGAGRVLAASSPTVLGYGAPAGWVPDRLPLDEQSPLRPWNAYSLSKLVVEETVRMFARSTPGVVVGSFRPCFVIAPEEWAGAPTQQGHTVVERLDSPALAAVSLFNYVDARDAGRFVVSWVERADPGMSGETFFVGADDALCRGDVREAIALSLPAAADQVGSLSATSAAFSSAKAEKLLGWRPLHRWRDEITPSVPTPHPTPAEDPIRS